MCRHCEARKELLERLRDGQIGEITLLKTYRLVGPAGFTGPKPPDMSELLYQVQNYLSFFWASGGLVHDFTSHNIDECCWMKGSWPVAAQGSAGRYYRGDDVDQNLDHYSVEYTFADGTNLFLNARNISGCHGEFASYAHGTQGLGGDLDLHAHAGQVPDLQGAQLHQERPRLGIPAAGAEPLPARMGPPDRRHPPGQAAQRGQRGAEASLVQIMGRMACHTGQVVTWDEAAPPRSSRRGLTGLTMALPAPLLPARTASTPCPSRASSPAGSSEQTAGEGGRTQRRE